MSKSRIASEPIPETKAIALIKIMGVSLLASEGKAAPDLFPAGFTAQAKRLRSRESDVP